MVDATDISQLRQRYSDEGIDESALAGEPISQFAVWFDQALNSGIPDANAFALTTATRTGYATTRTVLLKSYGDDGFIFYTNHHSRKGRQIAENPRVAMLFPWYALHRQVNIEGMAEKIDDQASYAYFKTRPRGSRIGAWASRQSQVLGSRGELDRQITEAEERFADGEIPLPSFWGGYRISPRRIEFWQGRNHRLHDRIVYRKSDEAMKNDGSGWDICRLSP